MAHILVGAHATEQDDLSDAIQQAASPDEIHHIVSKTPKIEQTETVQATTACMPPEQTSMHVEEPPVIHAVQINKEIPEDQTAMQHYTLDDVLNMLKQKMH